MSAQGRESNDATSSSSAEQSASTPDDAIPSPLVYAEAASSETAGPDNSMETTDKASPLPHISTGEVVHLDTIVAELSRATEEMTLRIPRHFYLPEEARTDAAIFRTDPTIDEFASYVEREILKNERFRDSMDENDKRQRALLSDLTDLERMTAFANVVSTAVSGGSRPVNADYVKCIVENMWRPMRRYLENDLKPELRRLDRCILELKSILRVDSCQLWMFSTIMKNKRETARDLIEKMEELRWKIGKKSNVRLEAMTDFEAVLDQVHA